MMNNKKNIVRQICPICRRYVKASSRYPNYVCIKCVVLATDKKGRLVEFYNTDVFGHGCVGKYRNSERKYPFHACYINGVKCKVEEAYFGGIVFLSSF